MGRNNKKVKGNIKRNTRMDSRLRGNDKGAIGMIKRSGNDKRDAGMTEGRNSLINYFDISKRIIKKKTKKYKKWIPAFAGMTLAGCSGSFILFL